MGGSQRNGCTDIWANPTVVSLGRLAYCSTLLQGDCPSSAASPKRLPNTATPAAPLLDPVNPHTSQLVTYVASEPGRHHSKLLQGELVA